MPGPSWGFGTLGLTAMLLGCAPAAKEAEPREPAPARAPAAAAEPRATADAYYSHFTDAHGTLLYLGDLLPVIDRYVAANSTDGSSEVAWWAIDRAAWEGVRAPVSMYLPRELALGFSDRGVDVFDHLVRAGFHWGMVAGSLELNAGTDRRQLHLAQAALARELQQLDVGGVTAWVRFRAPETARRLVDELAGALESIAAVERIGEDEARALVSFQVDPAEIDLRAFAVEMELARTYDDPAAEALGRAVLGLHAEIRVRRIGDGLRIDVGTEPGGEPLTRGIAPLAAAGAGTQVIAGSTWDSVRFKQAAAGWLELLASWEGSAAYLAASDMDSDGLLLDMRSVARELAEVADTGDLGIWLTPDALRIAAEFRGGKQWLPLAGNPVSRFVPDGVAFHMVEGGLGLDYMLRATLDRVEMRLTRESWKEWLTSGEGGAADQRFDRYYAEFRDVRRLIYEESTKVFEPPMTWFLDTTPDPRAPAAGIFPAFAFVGKVRPKWDAHVFTSKLYGDVTAALSRLATSGQRKGSGKNPGGTVRKRDLGLGVPTWELDGKWLGPVWREHPDTAATWREFTSAAGKSFRPHYFTVDEYIVLSSSPALSRRILAQYRSGQPAIEIAGPEVTALLTVSSDRLADWIARIGLLAPTPAERLTTVQGAEFLRRLGTIQAVTRSQGDARRTEMIVRLPGK